MTGGYPIEALANAILDEGDRRSIDIDPMKLQKLMYLSHGYYLAASGNPLVDEQFEAWQYGPVAPSIYHAFKRLGGSAISSENRAICVDGDFIIPEEPRLPKDDKLARKVINFVFDTYGKKSSIYLSELTHKVDSPWFDIRKKNPAVRNATIPSEVIMEYFKKLI